MGVRGNQPLISQAEGEPLAWKPVAPAAAWANTLSNSDVIEDALVLAGPLAKQAVRPWSLPV